MKNLFLLVSLLPLVSCNTLSNPYAAERAPATIPPGSGVVVVSTGGVDTCGTMALSLHFQTRGTEYHQPSVAGLNVNWGAIKSDFADHRGAFSVILLKAGDYQAFPRPIDANWRGKRIPKADFSLAPGELLYLGEYFVSTPCSSQFYGGFRDQEERDMGMLKARRPDLSALSYTKRIATFTGYLLEPEQ